jgi:hypothetical protein
MSYLEFSEEVEIRVDVAGTDVYISEEVSINVDHDDLVSQIHRDWDEDETVSFIQELSNSVGEPSKMFELARFFLYDVDSLLENTSHKDLLGKMIEALDNLEEALES